MTAISPIILYVDDERANRIVFEQTFSSRFNVRVAESGQAALQTLAEGNVGVLVTDQRMPDMSGNELLEKVRSEYPDIIRLVITAYSDLDPILRAVNDGLVARYVIKPWVRPDLEDMLAWALDAYRLGTENSAAQLRLLATERLVTLGSIHAAILHDVNQPLSYMVSNTERLGQLAVASRELADLVERHSTEIDPRHRTLLADLAAELPDIVEDLHAGCKVMSGLTNSVRKLLRPASDEERHVCDPLAAIRFTVSVCRQAAMRARGHLAYDGPDQLPMVAIGSTELTQTLINLVSNAAQALERREDAPGGRVVVRAKVEESTLRVQVVDDGPGMTPEVLNKVGTPFFTTRVDGTGLGVHQCRRLLEKEGGKLSIESAEGMGTKITVTLPVAPPEPLPT